MRVELESLTVRGFRGIPDERTFEFGGENAVVSGPNGSGKSTVLQAIEFLLTGEIEALSGSGTGGIHISQHVPNRRADPDDTVVRGQFTADGQSFQAYRRFTNRGTLVAEDRPPAFRALVELANRGLLGLTRDELLELLLATPGNRKQQLFSLLDTSGVDERRRQLKRLSRNATDEADTHGRRVRDAIDRIEGVAADAVIDEETLDRTQLLAAVNERRRRLGGDPLASLDDGKSFRDGVQSPVDQAGHPLQRSDVQETLSTVRERLEKTPEVTESLQTIRESLQALQADRAALTSLSDLDLVHQGLDRVTPTTTECPLCQTEWEEGELQEHLEQREERLSRIENRTESIEADITTLRRELVSMADQLSRLETQLGDADLSTDVSALWAYRAVIEELVESLEGVSGSLATADPSALEATFPTTEARAAVDGLLADADSFPDRTVLEQCWDELKTLHEAYEKFLTATSEHAAYTRAADEFEAARQTFLEARDRVLDELYADVSQRFGEIYRTVNPDEGTFDPSINQTDTGVKFSVDFYDDGDHPPNALHSEGHQDLMGVCLFLALADSVTPLERTPILLDDVVMSVDSTHRRRFAAALAGELSDRFQVFVTTHDEQWAETLVAEGVVDASDVLTFESWNLESGPEIGVL